jgi:hypothetical protein
MCKPLTLFWHDNSSVKSMQSKVLSHQFILGIEDPSEHFASDTLFSGIDKLPLTKG